MSKNLEGRTGLKDDRRFRRGQLELLAIELYGLELQRPLSQVA